MCTSLSISLTRTAISALGILSCFNPKAIFCSTVMCGNKAYDWNIILIGRSYGGISVMSTPSRKIRPSVGFSKPASMRNKVDLPEPEPPKSANISPRLMVNETSSTARTSSKSLLTRSILSSTLSCVFVVGLLVTLEVFTIILLRLLEYAYRNRTACFWAHVTIC